MNVPNGSASFRPYFHYCSSSLHYCEDRFDIHVFIRSSNIRLSYIHSSLLTSSQVHLEPTAPSWLVSSVGRALHRYRERGNGLLAYELLELVRKTYLLTSDYYSDFFELDHLKSPLSVCVIRKLKAHFAHHGIPEQLVTYNDSHRENGTLNISRAAHIMIRVMVKQKVQ